MKIVINASFSKFSLSAKCVQRYAEIKKINLYPYCHYINESEMRVILQEANLEIDKVRFIYWATEKLNPVTDDELNKHYFSPCEIKRDDPALIQAVEELGEDANSHMSCLKIVEIPDDVDWYIYESHGFETIEEKHRSWN